jgi:hypothetical protein
MPRDAAAGPKKSLQQVMTELRPIWDAWSGSLGDRGGWRVGAAYGRESHADSLQGYSPATQLRQMLAGALERRVWIPWARPS